MNDRKPGECPKCGIPLEPPGVSGGRPRRWCSAGCQRAGEAQMRIIHAVIKRLELDKTWQQRHSRHVATIEQIDELIAERRREYDRLAGVPERGDDE